MNYLHPDDSMQRRTQNRTTSCSRQSALLGGVLAAALLLGAPHLVTAQQIGGLVAEQATLAPVSDAVVTLFRVTGDNGDMEPAGTSTTDEEGAFLFVPSQPGLYRVQADYDGLSSPISPAIEVSATEGTDDIVLMVPSPLLMMAGSCDQDNNPGAVVVGTVRDRESEVPLPGVRVVSRWDVNGEFRERHGESNGRGHYLLCGVEPAGWVQFRAESLGRTGEWAEVEIPRPAMVFHDVELELSPAGATGQDVISEFILLEMAGSMGDLRGELYDQNTGEPIRQAVVRVRGTSLQGVTDNEGRFSFTDLQPGSYTLEIQHLGYSVQSSEVEVPEGRDVLVRLQISPQAVQLEGIEVTARAAVEEAIRTTPFRRDVVAGRAMAEAEAVGNTTVEVLRRSVPGLRVTEQYTEFGTVLCIQTNRRIQTFGAGGCDMAQVIVDGTRISSEDAANFLLGLSVSEIESIEFLPPSQATILYGTGGNVSNGVVVIYTRGRGPYASPTRDR